MSFAAANNNNQANFTNAEAHQYEDGHDDQFEDEPVSNVPLYEGELRPEWRYYCTCYNDSGLALRYFQSLSGFLLHVIQDHADGESLDLIARVALAQHPPSRCGPTKANRGASRTGSASGGSVRSGSVHGSRQGSVHGGSRQGSVHGSMHGSVHDSVHSSYQRPVHSRGNLNVRPQARPVQQNRVPLPQASSGPPATPKNTREVLEQMLAQNNAIMQQMQGLNMEAEL